MANLYIYRDSNIRRTWLLFTVFLVFVIGLGWVFAQIYGSPNILWLAVIFSVLMSFFSYWYSDKLVLRLARAEPIDRKNAEELYNIIENLTITAGLPMPKIYLIKEKAPNAFATGRDPKHAVVAVTEGLLDILDRSELEGVLSHELSHIGNRDMLVSTVVVVLAGFISLASDFLMRSFYWGGMFGGRDDNRSNSGLFILIGFILSILAPLAASLIQLAVSRQREFLADASGALLTRYPEGLASALVKIGKSHAPLAVANTTTAHLWISDPFKNQKKTPWFAKLFMTHPPIEERIARLRGIKI